MASLADVLAALRAQAGFEAVDASETKMQARIVGRVPMTQSDLNMNNWLILCYRLLVAARSRPWKIDISRNYLVREDIDKLVYSWRLLLQGENISSHYTDFVQVVRTSPRSARAELTEVRLYGLDPDRNNTAGGKRGAGPAGSVMVGPAAAAMKRQGG